MLSLRYLKQAFEVIKQVDDLLENTWKKCLIRNNFLSF